MTDVEYDDSAVDIIVEGDEGKRISDTLLKRVST